MNRIILILLIFVLSSTESFAQCSMLSAIMETDQQYEAAKGLNRYSLFNVNTLHTCWVNYLEDIQD